MKLKVALTHDVDRTIKTYQYITHLIKALKKGDIKSAINHLTTWNKRKEIYWNFEEIIKIEESFNVKSTFFFLIETYPFKLFKPSEWKLSLGRYDINEPRIVSKIKQLDKEGWEIGLHGSYDSFKNINLLKKEKKILEKILGHSIIGVRQHYLNLDNKTWELQKKAGFKYDSSWGFRRKIGFKENRIKPFSPFNDYFYVFPLSIMDSCYMNVSPKNEALNNIINLCIENNGILVINWHSNNFDETDFPNYKKNYMNIIEECIKRDAYFGTLSDFYKKYNDFTK